MPPYRRGHTYNELKGERVERLKGWKVEGAENFGRVECGGEDDEKNVKVGLTSFDKICVEKNGGAGVLRVVDVHKDYWQSPLKVIGEVLKAGWRKFAMSMRRP